MDHMPASAPDDAIVLPIGHAAPVEFRLPCRRLLAVVERGRVTRLVDPDSGEAFTPVASGGRAARRSLPAS